MITNYNFKKQIFFFFLVIASSFSFGQCWNTIAGGSGHSLGIKSDGTLWSWGRNDYGQCGQGNYLSNYGIPTQIGTDTNWIQVSAGNSFSYAIKNNGTLWAWGRNDFSQLGDGTTINKNIPIQIGSDNDWTKISTGIAHTLAIKSNGTLWSWGYNVYGQLGLGSFNSAQVPTQVGLDNNWSDIASGFFHSLFLKSNGTIWSCGFNDKGQLGNGSTSSLSIPTQIGTQSNWIKIASGSDSSGAINSENKLFMWGYNSSGQLGIGNYIDKNLPTLVNEDIDWNSIVIGGHSVAIKNNTTVWTWGSNFNGQLGNGGPSGFVGANINLPQQINNENNWDKIFTGLDYSFSIKTDGELWAWGFNGWKQLGNNSTAISNVPILINCPTTLGANTFAESSFLYYPNPTNSIVNISAPNEIISQINVHDITGRLLKSQKGNNENEQVNIQELPSAMYMMEIKTDKGSKTMKIIKQ